MADEPPIASGCGPYLPHSSRIPRDRIAPPLSTPASNAARGLVSTDGQPADGQQEGELDDQRSPNKQIVRIEAEAWEQAGGGDSSIDAEVCEQMRRRKGLDLLAFVDGASALRQTGHATSVCSGMPSTMEFETTSANVSRAAWESVCPPSFAEWAYRGMPKWPPLPPRSISRSSKRRPRSVASTSDNYSSSWMPSECQTPPYTSEHDGADLSETSVLKAACATHDVSVNSGGSVAGQRRRIAGEAPHKKLGRSAGTSRRARLGAVGRSGSQARARTPSTRAPSRMSSQDCADEMRALSVLSRCSNSSSRCSPWVRVSASPSPTPPAHGPWQRSFASGDEQASELREDTLLNLASSSATTALPSACSHATMREVITEAAENASARAKAIGLAIRAKAVVRLAASSAARNMTRKELYCHEFGEKSYWESQQDSYDGVVDGATFPQRAGYRPERFKGWEAQMEVRTEYDNYLRRPMIKVPHNTTLGRMVKADPERAAKYNIEAVAPHYHNVGWPPPRTRYRPSPPVEVRLKAHWERKKKHMVGEVDDEPVTKPVASGGSSPSAANKWSKVRAVGMAMSTIVSTGARSGSPDCDDEKTPRSVCDGIPAEHRIDFDLSDQLLSQAEKYQYSTIYRQHCGPSGGKLDRMGIQKALREAGLVPDTVDDKMKLMAVQQQVIEHCRGEGNLDIDNPLKDKRGHWSEKEFILMIAGDLYLHWKDQLQSDQAVADEHRIGVRAVTELRRCFNRFDEDASGTISIPELRHLLFYVHLNPSDEDLSTLLEACNLGGKQEFEFGDYVRIVCKVEEFLEPGKKIADLFG